MMKSLFCLLFFSAIFSADVNAQVKPKASGKRSGEKTLTKRVVVKADTTTIGMTVTDTTGWAAADQKGFMNGCIGSSKMGKEKGTAFCACMLEKVMQLYPNAADAAAMTKEKATDLAKECFGETRKGDSTWSVNERTSFLKECGGKTSKKLGTAKTKTYCNCMLAKIEKAYPNPLDAEKMTPEELSTWATECGGQ